MERDNIFQVYCSICEGFNCFFSSKTQKKLLSDDMSVVSLSIINSLDTQTRLWADGDWNRP